MSKAHIVVGVVFLMLVAVVVGRSGEGAVANEMPSAVEQPVLTVLPELADGQDVATFATGCFWCMEAVFQETAGVVSAVSGYAGGTEVSPTYEDVYTGATSHRESVQVIFDRSIITYEQLLDVFWQGIDPTDAGGQFVDRGFPYTAAVFYTNQSQESLALESRLDLAASQRFDEPIVTPILPFTTFYEAEEYHQDFYKKSSERYKNYEEGSGRQSFRASVWKDLQAQ